MSKRIKVLHIGEYVSGGVATYIRTLISRDGEKCIDNYLLMSDYKSEHDWMLDADRVSYYKYKRSFSCIFPAILCIYKHIKKNKPDVIYCHSTWAGVMTRLPMLFFRNKAKIIYNAHGWSFNMETILLKKILYASIERILSKVTDTIINVSKYEFDSAIKMGLPSQNMTTIYNGIAVELPCYENNIQNFNIDHSKINILFVGRFDTQKGLDYLLKQYYRKVYSNIHLYIIGDNVVNGKTSIIKESNERVTFLGWIPNSKITEYYIACDVVIMPSRWEAFGLVAIEAMRCGKPVIVSNKGALPEIISDGINGIVFDMDDSESLVSIFDNIAFLLREFDSNKIRDIFKEKFVADKMIASVQNCYVR